MILHMRRCHWQLIICILVLTLSEYRTASSTQFIFPEGDTCFCQLQGQIDDCSCNVDTVDYYNNAKIYPRLSSLLCKDYFRYFKVFLKSSCPFWNDNSKCASEDCSVKPCDEGQLPPGLKNEINKYTKEAQELDHNSCDDDELGYLNTTISEKNIEEFKRWKSYDDAQDNFCEMDDDKSVELEYVDLLLNPERYTGYKGASANRIWNSIYQENCFKPQSGYGPMIDSQNVGGNPLEGLCLEKRVFYRALSGLHASINIHLSANYHFPAKDKFGKGSWGPNLEEFKKRFDPETTNGEGPQWLRNLYFVYLLELRALAKAAPYLEQELFYTSNEEEDGEVRKAVKDILEVSRSFPDHFNESTMFAGDGEEAKKLKEEFKIHFRNISRIMDCVGCDKCKLWGKLQIQGLGTAFKILFSGHQTETFSFSDMKRSKFQLNRTEIVSLFNGIGRLSSSIQALETFRSLMR